MARANRKLRMLRVAVLATVTLSLAVSCVRSREPAVVVGRTSPTTSTPPTEPAVIEQPVETTETTETTNEPSPPGTEPGWRGDRLGLHFRQGRAAAPAIEFTSSIAVRPDLVFVLVAGSDARPGESILRTRADAIHLLAVNPASGAGTIVGFPRDSWVRFPNGRRGKLNDALARGGPEFLARTVRDLTGLPVHYYVVTGFRGLARMVDTLGGVDVYLERGMDDRYSGARFAAGWNHFDGEQALAYTRNRRDVPHGDFSRSENQANLILASLAKLRSEVADDGGLHRWIGVLVRDVRLDVPRESLPELAAIARRLDFGRVVSVVLPGRIGYAGRVSVVYLTPDAPALFADLRDDAVAGTAPPPTTTSTASTSPTTTSTTDSLPPVVG